MKESLLTVSDNWAIAPGLYCMRMQGDVSAITAPGQFIHIRVPGCFLRRPISVCDRDAFSVTIVYKVVGSGTEALSRMTSGQKLEVLTGLGNGFDTSLSGQKPLLIGGGVGSAPMLMLAKELLLEHKEVTAALGFNSREDVFLVNELEELGCRVLVSTVDGSFGTKGFVTGILPDDCSFYYACGPEPMLRAVWRAASGSGQLSFEERMGCGFGACMGCTCQTITGNKRICREGPVLRKEELLWGD